MAQEAHERLSPQRVTHDLRGTPNRARQQAHGHRHDVGVWTPTRGGCRNPSATAWVGFVFVCVCSVVCVCACVRSAHTRKSKQIRDVTRRRARASPPRAATLARPRHAVRRVALCAAHVARTRRVAPRAPLECRADRACPAAVRACPASARRLRPAAAGRGLPAPLVGPGCRPGAPGGWRLSAPQPIPPCRRQRLRA